MQQRTDVPDRGLRRNAVGLAGLMAQSLGVTAPEISAVVIASVVAAKVAGATPFAFLIAGVGALGLAVIYGRFARHVPNAGGTYAIVRAGLGRDAGFLSGWVVLAVGIVFVPALLIAAGFLMQNFWGLVAPDATFLHSNWIFWAALGGALILGLSYFGIQISARVLLTLTAIGVAMLTLFGILILAKGGADGLAWKAFGPNGNSFHDIALAVGIAMTGFSGFETAVFLAEEAHTPRRQVPKAVVGAVLLAIAFFLFVTFSIVVLTIFVGAMFVAGLIWQGSGLEGGLTFFSWLLQAGATGILPVYGLVAIGGAVHAPRYGGTVVDKVIAPALALVVVALAEWSEFVGQSAPFKYAPYFMLV